MAFSIVLNHKRVCPFLKISFKVQYDSTYFFDVEPFSGVNESLLLWLQWILVFGFSSVLFVIFYEIYFLGDTSLTAFAFACCAKVFTIVFSYFLGFGDCFVRNFGGDLWRIFDMRFGLSLVISGIVFDSVEGLGDGFGFRILFWRD